MKTSQRDKLATIIGKLGSLQAEINDIEERRKLNRALNFLMKIIYPNAPPYDGDNLELPGNDVEADLYAEEEES